MFNSFKQTVLTVLHKKTWKCWHLSQCSDKQRHSTHIIQHNGAAISRRGGLPQTRRPSRYLWSRSAAPRWPGCTASLHLLLHTSAERPRRITERRLVSSQLIPAPPGSSRLFPALPGSSRLVPTLPNSTRLFPTRTTSSRFVLSLVLYRHVASPPPAIFLGLAPTLSGLVSSHPFRSSLGRAVAVLALQSSSRVLSTLTMPYRLAFSRLLSFLFLRLSRFVSSITV